MRHWLVKSEPEAYSWAKLVREKKGRWDGVRNYTARNNLRAMAVGDLCLFYHSVSEKAVVGICKVVGTAYPDPTAEKGDWSCVDVAPVRALEIPVELSTIKSDPALSAMELLRQSRLSVVPVTQAEFERILELGKAA
jgi:predicted RNA-binding protein with PUA-like domain